MRKAIQFLGFVLLVMGVSGTIDHLAFQPIMGFVLNFFNDVVIPRLSFLDGYELFANLIVAGVGLVICVAAEPRAGSSAWPRRG